jgi:hypothetical protein
VNSKSTPDPSIDLERQVAHRRGMDVREIAGALASIRLRQGYGGLMLVPNPRKLSRRQAGSCFDRLSMRVVSNNASPRACRRVCQNRAVYSDDATALNIFLSCSPVVFTAASITSATSAAIRPYSIAVTPEFAYRKNLPRRAMQPRDNDPEPSLLNLR